jgi:hypothetical protein
MPAPRKNVPNNEERLEMHWKASQRKPPKYDYLKYYKIVRQWVKYKYGVSLESLEMMLFLRSERYFSNKDMDRYAKNFPWDKNRLRNLREDGWVLLWREGKGNTANYYTLSPKANSMIDKLYGILEGDIEMDLDWAENGNYTTRRYVDQIKAMNRELREFRRQQRRPDPGSQ